MVRVVLVCGSLQERSANRAALDVARAALVDAGALVDDARDLDRIAAFNPDRSEEPSAALAVLRAALADADGVVIAAPEYAGGLAGGLKNVLDSFVGTADLYRKPVVVMSAGTTGGVHALDQLVRTLLWQGAHVVGRLGIAAPRTKSDPHGRFTDASTLAAIERLVDDLIDAMASPADGRVARVRQVAEASGIDAARVV